MYGIEMFKKAKKTAKAVKVLLWANVALAVITLATSTLFSTVLSEGFSEDSVLIAVGAVGILGALIFLVTAVVFLVWMNRAHKSAQGVGDVFFEHTSASAVWWWFVPIASLWKPMQVMREIHSATRPLTDDNGDKMISTWWGLWVAMNFTSGCQGYGGGGGELDQIYLVFGVIAVGFEIAAAYYAVQVVETITEQQQDAWTGEKTAEVFS